MTEERTYAHKVSADLIQKAISIKYWDQDQTQLFKTKGINRGSLSELSKKIPALKEYILPNLTSICTLFNEVEIENNSDILINNVFYEIPNIIVFKSNLNSVSINSMLENKEGLTPPDIIIIDSIINKILITDRSKVGDFHISDNSFIKNFEINKNSIIGNFKISEYSSIVDNFIINKSLIGSFWCNKIILGNFLFLNNSKMKFLKIDDSICGDFLIDGSSSPSWNIKNSQILSVRISNSKIRQLWLYKCFLDVFRISNDSEVELFSNSDLINYIDFQQINISKNTILSFSKVAIYACNMNEFSVLGNLHFRNMIRISTPYIFFDAHRYLKLIPEKDQLKKKKDLVRHREQYLPDLNSWQKQFNIKIPTFRIAQSSLGKTEFTECALGEFNFEYNNSKITEIFISGGSVPEKVEVYRETNNLKKLEQEKSFFDQLKKVFEGQGDIVRGTKYHAKASAIQMKILWKEKNIAELLVYAFNWLSNKHGESWLRGFLFTLVISLIGFYFYNSSLITPKYEFAWGNTDYIGDWAQFILPTHRVDFMVNEPSSTAEFIDVVFRILIGYGIYQFISAFRKHGKRS